MNPSDANPEPRAPDVEGIRAMAISVATAVPPTYSPEQRARIADGFAINSLPCVADFPAIVDAVFRAIDLPVLLAAHAQAEGEQARLLAFARKILAGYRDGDVGGIDGADVEAWATECGLLVPTEMTEACGEHCACADVGDFPLTCYRFGAALVERSRT